MISWSLLNKCLPFLVTDVIVAVGGSMWAHCLVVLLVGFLRHFWKAGSFWYVSSELVKWDSVKVRTLVKPFLIFQELTLWGRLPKENAGKEISLSICPSVSGCPAQKRVPVPKGKIGIRVENDENSLANVLRMNVSQGKCFFTWLHTSGFCVCFVPAQSWVSASRPESSPQTHWNGNVCPLLWNADYFRNVSGSWGFLKLTL